MNSENQTPVPVRDPNRIDVHDTLDLRNWSRSLDTTPEQLRQAVANVGPFVEKVCEYLKKY